MDTMINWFNALDPTLRVYWGIAIFISIVFAIQMVLTFVGMGHTDAGNADFGGFDGDMSGDMSGDMGGDSIGDGDGHTMDTGGAIQLFTVRNAVNFLLGVGWGGVCFYSTIPNHLLLCLVSVLVGFLFVGIFLLLFRQLMRLEQHGNFTYESCIGIACDVYLRIPASRAGVGKVQISVNGSVHELDAMTDGEKLPSGTKVRVKALVDGRTLLVDKV